MAQVNVEPDLTYALAPLVGSIDVEYGVRGAELEKTLNDTREQFVRAMELRGNVLYRHPKLQNPRWVTSGDGIPLAYFDIDWAEERQKVPIGPDGGPMPRKRATSLDEAKGWVEYRIVGIFWCPKMQVEILKSKYDRYAAEKKALNPVSFVAKEIQSNA